MSQTLARPSWMDDPDVTVTAPASTGVTPVVAPVAPPAGPAWMNDPDVTVTPAPVAQPDPDVTITAAPAPTAAPTAAPTLPVTPDAVQPAQAPEGIVPSLWSGLRDAFTEGQRLGSGGAFDDAQATPEVPRTWGGNIAYGLSHSSPTTAMTLLGATGGTVAGGPLGGIAGGSIAALASTAAQTVIPAYDAARRQGLEHDAAVDQALKMAAAQGVLGGATGAIMGAPLFRNMVGSFLFNTVAVNPTAGLVNRGIVTPKITGQEPTSDQLASGVVEDVLSGAVTHGAIRGGQALGPRISSLFGRGGTPDPTAPAPDPNTPLLPAPPAGLLPAPAAAPDPNAIPAITVKPTLPPETGTGAGTGTGTGTGAGTGTGGRTVTATVDIRPATHDPVTGNPRPVEDQIKNLNQGIAVAQSVIDNPGLHPPESVSTAQGWISTARATLDQLTAATPAQSAAVGAGTAAAAGASAAAGVPATPATPPVTGAPDVTTPPPSVSPGSPAPAAGQQLVPAEGSGAQAPAPPAPDPGQPAAVPGGAVAAPVPAEAPAPVPEPGSATGAVPAPVPGGPDPVIAAAPEAPPAPAPAPRSRLGLIPPDAERRPVTSDEAYTLSRAWVEAQAVYNRLGNDPSTPPEQLQAAKAAVDQAQKDALTAKGPPVKEDYRRDPGGYEAAVKAHEAAINQRIHEPAPPPTPPVVATPPAPPGPPVVAAPPQAPVATPAPDTFGTRPVTSDEIDTLNRAVTKAQTTYDRLRKDPNTPPEKLQAAKAALDQAQKDRSTAKGPPVKGTYLKDPGGAHQASHDAAVKAHEAAVNQRIHAEGTTPAPDPAGVKALFRLGGGKSVNVVRGKDTQGRDWVGTGHAMVRDTQVVEKAATQAAKGTTANVRSPAAAAIDSVTMPNPRATYEPVTWHRQVMDGSGKTLVLGTTPGGKHVALQKPIYDTLHAAAGPGGTVVMAPGAKSDTRVFARNAKGETVGVGQPMRVDQALAKTWSGAPASAPAPATPPAGAKPPAATAALSLEDTDSPEPSTPGTEPPEGVNSDDWENFTESNDFDAGNGVLSNDDIPPELKPKDADPGDSIQEEEEEPPMLAATDQVYNDLLGTIARLTGATPSKANRVNLQNARVQLKRREAAIARTRAAWKPKHTTVQPGAPKSFVDYKFADGTSVFHGAFADAGLAPELWVNKPIAEQNVALAKQVKAKFGFAEVVIHTSADAKQTRDQLLDTYKSGQDMANALTLPYTALGMNKRITLRLQGHGRRDYYGVYEPGTMTVGIVGQAQSFMHEWVHALDHMLSDQLVNAPNRRELLSKNARDNDLVPGQHDVLASFAKLINTVFYDDQDLIVQRLRLENTAQQTNRYTGQPTTKAQDAQRQLDKLEGGASRLRIKPSAFRSAAQAKPNAQYWASAHELLARLGEAWAARAAQNAGVSPRGLLMQDEAYLLHTDPRIASTFPSGDERMRMFDAMSKLFEDIRHAAIFPGGVGAKSTDLGMSDPSTWGRLNPKHDDTSSDIRTALRRDLQNLRNLAARYKVPLFFDPARPTRSTPVRRADLLRQHAFSSMAMMQTIIKHAEKHTPAGAPYLQELLDKLMHDPGSGRLVHEVWEEMVRRRSRRTTLAFTNALKDHDLDEMTPLQGQMLRHVMTTGDKTYPANASMVQGGPRIPIPKNIQALAEQVRLLLDLEYDWLKKSGIPLTYARSGYFPRLYDDQAISADGDRFKAAATELYKLMFDRDVGETDPDPVKMLAYWKEVPDFDKSAGPAQLRTDMTAMGRKLRRIDQINTQLASAAPGTAPDPKLTAERDKLETEVTALAVQNSASLGTLVGERGAHDWHTRVLAGGPTDFDTRGPSAKFTRGRVLPPEADQIMRDFMVTDPLAAIPAFLEASARRGAFARQFGVENNLIDRNLDLAAAAGVVGEDLAMFRNLIEQNTGRTRNTYSRLMVRGANYISAWATMMLLPKAAFSTIHEPMAAALSTGDMKLAFGTFGRQFRNIISKASRRETAELADFLGITTSVLHESAQNARTVEYRDTPNTARIMSAFFRMTMLTQITTAQRRAGLAPGVYVLRRWANQASAPAKPNKRGLEPRRIENRRDDAQRMLRELGVPDQHHGDLAAWLNGFDGIPTVQQLQASPMGDLFGVAVTRLINRTNQDPMRVQKPMRSNDPVGKLMFALMPFLYSFWQNVMEPALHRPGHAYHREYQRTLDRRTAAGGGAGGAGTGGPGGTGTGAAGPTPPGPPNFGDRMAARGRASAAFSAESLHVLMHFLPLLLAGILGRMLYNLLWNRDEWDKHENKGDLSEWLIGQAMSSIGVAGPLDVVVQAFTHMRYEADLAKLAQGANVSVLLTNARNLMVPWLNPNAEPKTNAAVYDQTLAAVKLFWEPAVMLALTKTSNMFPGGGIASAAAIMAWEASATPNLRGLTDFLVGSERGTKDPDADEGGSAIPKPPDLSDLIPKPPDPLHNSGKDEDGDTGAGGSSGAEGVMVGLLDDIMVPLLKAAPGPLKAVGFTALGGYAAWDWWNRTAPFRGAEPPEPKP